MTPGKRSLSGTTGSDIFQHCVMTRARQISRVLTAPYEQALRPFGINATQFTLLVLVHELGPISRADLGRRNHHDRSTLTRNLQPLLTEGWIAEGVADAADGRSRPLSVTRAGKKVLKDAGPAWAEAQAMATALIGDDGVAAIMGIAKRLPKRAG
ncbi:MarR family winged helix-turn-helix transcriptional regulator [Cupriavidus plantarum]|uniref:MarR family winged helix-turn-helix transcriptional regulator n=1 Tax=Cupriavidus plantarum TaxID=942865 RepID=UPI0015C7911D|nr:MarR family transcriptional regulator [Cupriavidus plantarum]NYI02115.1 DNA-binding MarR family transcriptional regulator [Cupriavidus plantarum]